VYHRNGIAYAVTRECLTEQRSIFGRKAGALVVEGDYVSIDTEYDIQLVDWLLSRNARGS
jgi:CMP-N-acetylneuraminic acid synthetase